MAGPPSTTSCAPSGTRPSRTCSPAHIAQAARDHDGLVVAAHPTALAAPRLLEAAEIARDAGPAEFVVERGGAQRALEHDVQRADDALGLADSSASSQGCSKPGMRRLRHGEATQTRPWASRRAPVAPSSRISPPEPVDAPGNGEIAVGVIVRLHLHQDVDGLSACAP